MRLGQVMMDWYKIDSPFVDGTSILVYCFLICFRFILQPCVHRAQEGECSRLFSQYVIFKLDNCHPKLNGNISILRYIQSALWLIAALKTRYSFLIFRHFHAESSLHGLSRRGDIQIIIIHRALIIFVRSKIRAVFFTCFPRSGNTARACDLKIRADCRVPFITGNLGNLNHIVILLNRYNRSRNGCNGNILNAKQLCH